MIRKAILISALQSGRVSGVELITETWRYFLNSAYGGAWADQEITAVNNATRDTVLTAVRTAKDAEYTILVFVGDGKLVRDELPWPEARCLLTDGNSLSERELNSGSARCTVVFDWSNGDIAPPETSSNKAFDVAKTRAIFGQAVEKAERGLVKIYASQSAPESGRGSSFSCRLLRLAEKWAGENQGILSLPQAVSLVSKDFSKSIPTLMVEYHGGRRLHHFPLAVST